MPTDTAEREQKPSLAWIMPSREEEKPTLCRINQHSPYARLWHDVGVTPVLLLDISFISHLSSFISHTLLEKKQRPRPKGAAVQQSKNHILQKEYFHSLFQESWASDHLVSDCGVLIRIVASFGLSPSVILWAPSDTPLSAPTYECRT